LDAKEAHVIIKTEVDLNDMWSNDFDETVAKLIKDEIIDSIRRQVKKMLKTDNTIEERIKKQKERLIQKALAGVDAWAGEVNK
jgi:hypothetical protein